MDETKPREYKIRVDANKLPEQIRFSADDNGFEIIPDAIPKWSFLEAPEKPKKKTWLEKKQRRW